MSSKNHARNSTRKPRRKPTPGDVPSPAAAATLTDIRRRLEIVRAIAYTCAAALEHQDADSDVDVGLLLQRSVGDELDRQIERLDQLLEARGEVKP
jgi:hypothetical protein